MCTVHLSLINWLLSRGYYGSWDEFSGYYCCGEVNIVEGWLLVEAQLYRKMTKTSCACIDLCNSAF